MSVLQRVLREATVTFCISCWSWIAALQTLRQLVFPHVRSKFCIEEKYKKSQKFKTKCNYFVIIIKEKVLKCLYCMAYARIRTNYNQFAGYKYEPQSIHFL